MANVLMTRGLREWAVFTTGTIKVLLIEGSSYTPNVDDDYVTGITAGAESTATDYVRKTLASKTETIDDTLNRITYDAADVVWVALGGAANETITGAVIYRELTTDADSILMAYLDTNDLLTNDTDLTLVFAATGIMYADQGA